MCGIAGIIEFNKKSNQVIAIKNMTKSLENRGPDDEGYLLNINTIVSFYGDKTDSSVKVNHFPNTPLNHIDTALNTTSNIAFGFKRLSIIDLSYRAHQPMCDLSKKYWIIFNGEIYNFKEIRSELQSLNYSFYSNSDTEIVLNAYIEWGEKSLQKLNGMFAFSILDTLKEEIFLARDRIGIKPLYYYQNKDRFVFGSTIKSIIDSKLYTPEINWEGLQQNFTFSITQRPSTCFLNVFALKPAYYIKVNTSTGQIIKNQYWQIPTATQDFSLTKKKSADLLEEGLYKSINYRLNADVKVGTFMSGGIDSTTITSIAKKLNPNINALTLGFHQKYFEYDEVLQAKKIAKMNNIKHIIHYENSNSIIDNMETIVENYEEPYHHLPANYAISKAASLYGFKVVLNGLGGDELFAGYDFYNKLNSWNLLKKLNSINKFIPLNFHPKIDVAKKIISLKKIDQFYSYFYSTFSDFEVQQLFKNPNYNSSNTLRKLYLNNQKFTDDIEALSYYNIKSYISNHQTRTSDQFSMNFSIETRFPFLDHQLIELAFTIPSKFKLKNNSHKFILKEVAKKHISSSCFSMQKKGLGLPLEYWYKNELKEFINDNINALKKRNLFDIKEINTILKTNNVRKTWHLVMTELWLKSFF